MARSFGQVLVDLGYVDEEQLELLREEQSQRSGELIGQIAISMNMLTEDQLAQALGEQLGLQVVAISDLTVPKEVLSHFTEAMAHMYRSIPLAFRDDTLTIATSEPQNLSVMDELRNFLGYQIRDDLKNDKEYQEALDENGELDLASAEALSESAPVRKLLNMVFLLGIKDHASDIHFEPFEDEFKIRIKADGTLYEMVPPPRHLASAITTRIKVLANLDIAEKRLPQDGRIRLMVAGTPIDFRVSVLPTMFGESVVCRILDKSVISLDLNNVGMSQELMTQFRQVIESPNGIILVTGPTGSGKTTTLYSALSELNVITEKLMTTEDPVEYDIDGIVQMPIDAEIGNTFAQCLRSILRQDPDVILVGEIRDRETAQIAVQASLTGHLVFSTLHTNDAPSTITRLKDMGIPEFLITATLRAILAQRLVRRVCANCRTEVKPSEEQLAELGLTPQDVAGKHFYQGAGCERCNNTGYKGRTAIHEFLMVNEEMRDIILRNGSVAEMRESAQRHGMLTLRDAGLVKVFEGTTTIEEVVRETVLDA